MHNNNSNNYISSECDNAIKYFSRTLMRIQMISYLNYSFKKMCNDPTDHYSSQLNNNKYIFQCQLYSFNFCKLCLRYRCFNNSNSNHNNM